MNDLIKVVQDEIADMVEHGLKEIQLDAPGEAIGLVSQSRSVESLYPMVAEPLMPATEITRTIHFCLGDIARKPSIEVQNLRSLIPFIQQLEGVVDRVHVECSYSGQWEEHVLLAELPESMEIIAGIADVKSKPAPVTELREKIEQLADVIPAERLLVSTSCGVGRVPHDEAIRLMRNLVKAAALVG